VIGRLLTQLLDVQDRWARPFGDLAHRVLALVFGPIRPVKDLLNGTWLGHPLHPAITDVPIGALLVALVLDIAGQTRGAFIAAVIGQLGFVAAFVTGVADYTDTDGRARSRAAVHGAVMLVAGGLTAASLVARQGGESGSASATVLLAGGVVVMAAGAYVGGDVVFALGNMVSRHAYRGASAKWIRLELAGGIEPDALPELAPTKAKLGTNTLALVRVGSTIHAMHDTCAHAGGPLSEGTIVDGCLQCPWHGSRFRLSDGRAVRGPAIYDQPTYEVRRGETGWEARRAG